MRITYGWVCTVCVAIVACRLFSVGWVNVFQIEFLPPHPSHRPALFCGSNVTTLCHRKHQEGVTPLGDLSLKCMYPPIIMTQMSLGSQSKCGASDMITADRHQLLDCITGI